jgi:hypothetical protein
MRIIQCPHCDRPNNITRKEINSIDRDGKIVKDCEGCHKLFVVEEDDGIYYAH